MADSIYSSVPLDLSIRQIRLLQVEPGKASDPLHCSLFVFPLVPKLDFYAISYTWGDPSDVVSVTVNGQPYQITKSLASVLRRLRTSVPNQYLPLWADALCINQFSTEEKNHQVALMGEIYTLCRECFVYLGELLPLDGGRTFDYGNNSGFAEFLSEHEGQNSSVIAKFLLEVNSTMDPSEIDFVLHICAFFSLATTNDYRVLPPICWKGSLSDRQRKYLEHFLHGINQIALNPYLHRLWTLQEIVLAQYSRIIFGHFCIPSNVFIVAGNRHEFDGEIRIIPANFELNARVSGIIRAFRALCYRQPKQWGPNEGLVHLAAMNAHRDSTRDEDRVYALLGMITNWYGRKPIQPDYKKSVVDIYTHVTREYIEGTRSLWPLALSHLRGKYHGQLPSWVIDWTAFRSVNPKDDMRHALNQMTRLYRANANWTGELEILNGRYIELEVIKLGVVSVTSEEMAYRTLAPFLRHGLQEWTQAAYSDGVPEKYFNGEDWYRVLLRTLCGDTSHGDDMWRCEEKDIENEISLFKSIFQNEEELARDVEKRQKDPLESYKTNFGVGKALEVNCDNRRLFRLDQGLIGVVDRIVDVGDEIFLIRNCPVPCVLRKTGQKQRNPSSGLELVVMANIASCYVHGVMDGQLLGNEYADLFGDIKQRTETVLLG